ncbi:hypothetical protein BAL199_14472 [alpha proteobacterium BAL199]|jgi:hypothetical protein|nr:hypothetical protein BAL199_14472 [alpha proteobacterium BAL199]
MRADVPPLEVMRHNFWLGTPYGMEDPRMRRVTECVGVLRPTIQALSQRSGDRCLMWALIAITVHMAVEAGEAEVIAAAFQSSAQLLELNAEGDALGAGL